MTTILGAITGCGFPAITPAAPSTMGSRAEGLAAEAAAASDVCGPVTTFAKLLTGKLLQLLLQVGS